MAKACGKHTEGIWNTAIPAGTPCGRPEGHEGTCYPVPFASDRADADEDANRAARAKYVRKVKRGER